MATRIIVADDHHLVRQGLRALLRGRAALELVGEAGCLRELDSLMHWASPQVVVLDVHLGDGDGIEAMAGIRALQPDAEFLILTSDDRIYTVTRALHNGALGFVLKSDDPGIMLMALAQVARHEQYLSPSLDAMPPGDFLTARETLVLKLLAEGKTIKEVAAVLGMGQRSTAAHRAELMTRLGLRNLADITRYAIRNRIIRA
jgi:DNA-binding NarL/FixJ family response regulator